MNGNVHASRRNEILKLERRSHANKLVNIPNMLLIAGTGRNCGKTTFACDLLGRFGNQTPIYALKVSHHISHVTSSDENMITADSLVLTEEMERHTGKDSSRMLTAGAVRSFFAVCQPEGYPLLLNEMTGLSGPGILWIVESAGLRHMIEPGVFVLVDQKYRKSPEKPEVEALRRFHPYPVLFDGKGFGSVIEHISVSENRWKLNPHDHI